MIVIEKKEIKYEGVMRGGIIVGALLGLAAGWAAAASGWLLFGYALLGALSYAVPPKTPDAPQFDFDFGVKHFSWGGRLNTDGAGVAIPVVYGKHRVSGHRIDTKLYSHPYRGDYLSILLAISEGEIKSITDIEIDGKPFVGWINYTDDGHVVGSEDPNFPGVWAMIRYGTDPQIGFDGFTRPGFNEIVNQQVCVITDPIGTYTKIYTSIRDFNEVNCILRIQDLYKINIVNPMLPAIPGNTYKTAGTITVKGEARLTGVGAYVEFFPETTIQNFLHEQENTFPWTSTYPFSPPPPPPAVITPMTNLELKGCGAGPAIYDIKITVKIIEGKAAIKWKEINCGYVYLYDYTNLALLGVMNISAELVSGQVPEITCLVEGRKVDVWTGAAWVNQYSENPAWALLDLMTDTRYGLGAWLQDEDLDIDKNSFKAWADYCEEQVDDMTGTMTNEDRHKIGIVVDSKKPAWEWFEIIAKTGRAFIMKSDGQYRVMPDEAENVSQLFTVGNIIEGSFKGKYISARDYYNVVKVHFNNAQAEEKYARDIVQYPAVIVGNERPKEIQLYGITRASQAQREALYQYNIGLATTMVIEFDCSLDALSAEIGDVIAVQHDITLWGQGGRIVNAYNAGGFGVIEIDRDDLVDDGVSTYKVMIRVQDDTVVEKTVSNIAGRIITFTTAFVTVPEARDTVYTYGTSSVFYKEFRIMEVNLNLDLTRHIVAIEYNADVYNLEAMTLPVRVETLLPNPLKAPASVANLSLQLQSVLNEQRVRENFIRVFFDKPEYILGAGLWDHCKIYLSCPAQNQVFDCIGETNQNSFNTGRLLYSGATYYVKVVSVGPSGAEESFDAAPVSSIVFTADNSIPRQAFAVFVDINGEGEYTDIQEAINALPITGGTVYVRQGEYLITDVILINKSNVTVQGSGGGTVLRWAVGVANHFMFKIHASGGDIENIVICDMIIEGEGQAKYGILIYGESGLEAVKNYELSNLQIYNCSDIAYAMKGIYIPKYATRGLIQNCTVNENFDGIHIGDTGGF